MPFEITTSSAAVFLASPGHLYVPSDYRQYESESETLAILFSGYKSLTHEAKSDRRTRFIGICEFHRRVCIVSISTGKVESPPPPFPGRDVQSRGCRRGIRGMRNEMCVFPSDAGRSHWDFTCRFRIANCDNARVTLSLKSRRMGKFVSGGKFVNVYFPFCPRDRFFRGYSRLDGFF